MDRNDNDNSDLRRFRAGSADEEKPISNAETRTLTFRGQVVKWFRQAADIQTVVLDELQKAGWPRSIKNPFQRDGRVSPKQRLHDAVEGLNRHQIHRLLWFTRDGDGGVQWWPFEQYQQLQRRR